MLVLTRKLGESIVIDGDVTITVSAIEGNRVKVALDAPRSRRIVRGEIAEQVRGATPPVSEPGWGTQARAETTWTAPANAK
ncbi:MAG: carbon storage regulator [Planctomycetaceae bacterium]